MRRADLSAAARLGMTIKLVARAERGADGRIRAAVTPMAVSASSPLGSTTGVTNLVDFDAQPVGRVTMSGPGAGGPSTSSAVLADILVLATTATPRRGSSCRRLRERRSRTTLPASVAGS